MEDPSKLRSPGFNAPQEGKREAGGMGLMLSALWMLDALCP